MVDTAPLIAVAQRLIQENGRQISLIQFNSTPQDANRPWRGPSADPRATPDSTLSLFAAFVPPSGARELGLRYVSETLLKRAEQIAIISPGANVDLSIFQEILDTGVYYKMDVLDVLKPGSATVLAFLGVRR